MQPDFLGLVTVSCELEVTYRQDATRAGVKQPGVRALEVMVKLSPLDSVIIWVEVPQDLAEQIKHGQHRSQVSLTSERNGMRISSIVLGGHSINRLDENFVA